MSGSHVSSPSSRLRPARIRAGGAALVLLLFVLALFARLLFTNRVLAGGDILHYFYPYRDYAAAALREGRIPFWDPYIFMGAPFLANPQAAVLYPLHWPLSWLPVTRQIYWSAALHTWLLGLGGYALMRRWGYGFFAALTTGVILAGSGFVGGLVGHINQLNGVAWLPWLILVLENVQEKRARMAQSAALFGLLTALMLLAGHTQSVYINLLAAGVWSIWPLVDRVTLRAPGRALRSIAPGLLTYGGGVILGALLAAPQLLPTLELSGLGLRSGGLSYSEAGSFSLKPLYLFWTLFPSYGLADLGVVFATEGYTEFVAYVGVAGMLLALLGAWRGRGGSRTFGLLFAGLGLFLAAGRWNPAYYAFYKIVPGFDLFRAPARWMMLYTLGMAVLAGIGAEALQKHGPRMRTLAPVFLVGLTGVELLLAARALPHTQTTAPDAVYGLRTAPAHLLTAADRGDHPDAAGRFLSMSALTFDPGDMADYHRILAQGDHAALDERAFRQLVIAQKSQEILAPNLPLLWRVPAVDGFDGGVLPLQRYLRSLTLFIPPEELVPDGRLREQIDEMPPADRLTLFNVEHIITDKVRDLWYDDVYYDRQIGARLTDELPAVTIDAPIAFEATHINVIGFVAGEDAPGPNRPIARVDVLHNGAITETLTINAGHEPGAAWADPRLDSPAAAAAGAEIAYRDVEKGEQEYLARLSLAAPLAPEGLIVTRLADDRDVVIRAVTLVDARTGMFTPLLPSDRGAFSLVHSGDVKIYRNEAVTPRARLLSDWQPVGDPEEALAYLEEDVSAALGKPALEGDLPADFSPQADSDAGRAEIITYRPERVEVRTRSDAAGLLVLTDTYYPGWQATVDGQAAPVLPANYLFRGVPLPAGEHTVILRYQPTGWLTGLLLAGLGMLLTVALFWVARLIG
ncbi:MAG: YfhO family protein [Caldilineaceae bacterium]|nr:YfhO family protein [Caldilineaceae bacterium]